MKRHMASLMSPVAMVLLLTTGTMAAVTIELVPVGNPGNVPDTRYYGISVGSVPYAYQIAKFEVTAGQYTVFLNALAANDTYGLYNANMDYDANPSAMGCNIKRWGGPGTYTYSVTNDWANRPVNYVSWGDAARFANWLSNGQPGLITPVPQDVNSTEDGSYLLAGATSDSALMAVTRKPGATWVIPTEDEWYKAAYFDPAKPGGAGYWDYPTKSDTPPINTLITPDPGNHANYHDFWGTGNGTDTIGSPYYRTTVGAFTNSASPYGTFDQGGNVWEWNETEVPNVFGVSGSRGIRNGAFDNYSSSLHASCRYFGPGYPSVETYDFGFRMACIPEPSSIALWLIGAISLISCVWRQRN